MVTSPPPSPTIFGKKILILSHRSLRMGPIRRCSFVVFFKTPARPCFEDPARSCFEGYTSYCDSIEGMNLERRTLYIQCRVTHPKK
jgi:hypothetical protein